MNAVKILGIGLLLSTLAGITSTMEQAVERGDTQVTHPEPSYGRRRSLSRVEQLQKEAQKDQCNSTDFLHPIDREEKFLNDKSTKRKSALYVGLDALHGAALAMSLRAENKN
jgi:hypothetical protein